MKMIFFIILWIGLLNIVLLCLLYVAVSLRWMVGYLRAELNINTIIRKIMNVVIDDYQGKNTCRAFFIFGTLIVSYICLLIPLLLLDGHGEVAQLYYDAMLGIYISVLFFCLVIVRKCNNIISDIVNERIRNQEVQRLKEQTAMNKDGLSLLSITYTLGGSMLALMVNYIVETMKILFDSFRSLDDCLKMFFYVGMDSLVKFVFMACLLLFLLLVVQPNYMYYSLMSVRLSEYDKMDNEK